MGITVKEVEYLALLARLQLTPQELERYAGQLDGILAHVEKLKTAKTLGVSPTTHPLSLSNVFREDQPQQSLASEEALSNAPDREGPFFKVPPVIEAS